MDAPPFPATLDEQLLFATTPIFYQEQIIGTGFFFRQKPNGAHHYLVTAFHVFKNIRERAAGSTSAECTVEYHMTIGSRVTNGSLVSSFTLDDVRAHPDEDLAVVRLTDRPMLPKAISLLQPGDRGPPVPFFKCLDLTCVDAQDADARKRLPACLSVLMPGYPSGLWDDVNRFPLLRTGSTASHPGVRFRNLPEGRLNMATAQVDSGAPVIGRVDLLKQGNASSWAVLNPPSPLQPFVFLGIHTGAESHPVESGGGEMAIARYLKAHLLTDVNTWTKPDKQRWEEKLKTETSNHSSPLPARRPLSESSPPSSPSKQQVSPLSSTSSPQSASSVLMDDISMLPKLRMRLERARTEMQSEGSKKEQIEIAFGYCSKFLQALSTMLRLSGFRFRTPAIFSESNGEGFEVVWYPGYTVLVRATSLRCYDGKSPTSVLDLSFSMDAVFDRVSSWLRQQPDFATVPVDEESDTDVDEL